MTSRDDDRGVPSEPVDATDDSRRRRNERVVSITDDDLGRNLVQLEFQLFNRWGNLVWEADSIGDYWHGQGPDRTHYVPDELYVWKAKYRHYTDPNGQLSPWYQASGSVRIIR